MVLPQLWVVGEKIKASKLNLTVQAVLDLQAAASTTAQVMVYPPANTDTPTTLAAGQVTWFSLGNVDVPDWANKARVSWSITGVYALATAINASAQFKIGSAAGVNRRILDPAVANQRFVHTLHETISGLGTGLIAVSVAAQWNAGAASSYRADALTTVSANMSFAP